MVVLAFIFYAEGKDYNQTKITRLLSRIFLKNFRVNYAKMIKERSESLKLSGFLYIITY